MRLLHYSDKPLESVYSRPHKDNTAGAYKTPGLWVSVEGEYDWKWWCEAERFGTDRLQHVTEIFLAPGNRILHISSVEELDRFTEEFSINEGRYHNPIDWERVRELHQGLIIAPYQFERRLSEHTMWYCGWDCASGVIWDAAAVERVEYIGKAELEAA